MGNRILITGIILIVVLSSFSCKDWFEDEDFSLTREEYSGEEIRIDGYYYNYFTQGSDLASITIFYRNGIVIDGIGGGSTLVEFENKFSNGSFYQNITKVKDVWGLYRVEDKLIMIERIVAMGGFNRIAYTDYGEILNDTTIHFYKHKESYKNVFENRNDTLHFKQFSPKPDSTNVFIK